MVENQEKKPYETLLNCKNKVEQSFLEFQSNKEDIRYYINLYYIVYYFLKAHIKYGRFLSEEEKKEFGADYLLKLYHNYLAGTKKPFKTLVSQLNGTEYDLMKSLAEKLQLDGDGTSHPENTVKLIDILKAAPDNLLLNPRQND